MEKTTVIKQILPHFTWIILIVSKNKFLKDIYKYGLLYASLVLLFTQSKSGSNCKFYHAAEISILLPGVAVLLYCTKWKQIHSIRFFFNTLCLIKIFLIFCGMAISRGLEKVSLIRCILSRFNCAFIQCTHTVS